MSVKQVLQINVYPSDQHSKKFTADIAYIDTEGKSRKKRVHFGAEGYEDFTVHGDIERRNQYIKRHKAREQWTKDGILTPGFWAKHLLWGESKSINRGLDSVVKMWPGVKANIKLK